MFGYLRSGFVRKKLVEMRDQMYAKLWEAKPEIDLSDDSFPAILLQVVILELALLWQAMEAVFYSRYVGTARGVALDHLGARLFLPRRPAAYARGTLEALGVAGTRLAQGTRLRHADGTEFELTRERVIGPLGRTDIAVVARKPGPGGNKAVKGSWRPIAGGVEVSGEPASHTFETFEAEMANEWAEVPVGERWDTRQKVLVEDLAFPLELDTVRFRVRNNTAQRSLYWVYCELTDPTTGDRLGDTQVRRIWLAAGEETVLTFSGQAWDVADRDEIAVAFVLGDGTTAPLEIAVNSSAPYIGGFRLAGELQPATDAWLEIVTVVRGGTRGGEDAEHDVMYSRRQHEAMARAAASIPEAIHSNLWALDDVRHVRVDYNPSLVVDQRGVAPKAVRATVAGGRVRDIGLLLLTKCVAAGIATCGSETIGVPCPTQGQTIPVSFERPSEVPVRVIVRLTLERGGAVPGDLATKIKDAITSYIGGPMSSGAYAAGLPPAEDVSMSHIHAACVRFSGVLSARVRVGRAGGEEQDGDLAIKKHDPVEIAVTNHDLIEVI